MDAKRRKGEWDELGNWDSHAYTVCVKWITNGHVLHSSRNATQRSMVSQTGRKSAEAGVSPVAQLVKNPQAMRETWVRFLNWKIPWRRERLPTPVFCSGEFHGLYSPWGCKESDTTE